MTNEELKITVTSLLSTATFEEGGEWLIANVEATGWKSFALQLRNDDNLFFDFLFSLTCIDWKTHLPWYIIWSLPGTVII